MAPTLAINDDIVAPPRHRVRERDIGDDVLLRTVGDARGNHLAGRNSLACLRVSIAIDESTAAIRVHERAGENADVAAVGSPRVTPSHRHVGAVLPIPLVCELCLRAPDPKPSA